MQTATALAIGTAGVAVPSTVRSAYALPGIEPDNLFVKAALVIPTLKAGAATWAFSADSGTTWKTMTPKSITAAEPTSPSASGFTGATVVMLEPLLPGWKVRMTDATSQAAVAATITSDHTAALSDVTLTAKATGAAGNSITIVYTSAGAGNPIACTVTGTAIAVALAANASGTITSTGANVKTKIDATTAAAALVTVAVEGAGSGVCNALSVASLTGGWDLPSVSCYFGI
jgi:hypothetical protein